MTDCCVRYYVDCTETVCCGLNTGIQRTVRNIIARQSLIYERTGLEVIPVVSFDGTFYRYSVDSDRKIFAPLVSKVLGLGRDFIDRLFFRKKVNIDGLAPPLSADLQQHLAREQAHLRIVESFRKVIPLLFHCAIWLDNGIDFHGKAEIADRDVIFYPDAFWYPSTYLTFTHYRALKILLLHDVIPLSSPADCDPYYSFSFRRNLSGIVSKLDGIITISHSELVQIKRYMDTMDCRCPLLTHNYWGADFLSAETEHTVGEGFRRVFEAAPVFIMVGSIEPRKNHKVVLDAFDEFWQQGGDASLCVIGKATTRCLDIKQRIDRHEFRGSKLFRFENVTDAELAYGYQRCTALVFASRAEGFGLPLVEAMWYGRPVIASDIPVFREIGGDYPRYFNLEDVQELVRQLHHATVRSVEYPEPKKWLTWDQSVLKLFEKIASMAEQAATGRSGT
jgi:alpha-1,2-rhamnosyltransferase